LKSVINTLKKDGIFLKIAKCFLENTLVE